MNPKFKNRDFIEFVYENDEDLEKCVIHVPEASKLSHDVKLRVAHGLFRMAKRTISDLECRIVVKNNWGFDFYDSQETMTLTTEIFYNIISSHYKRTNAGGIYNVVFDGEPRVFKGPSYRVSVKDLDSVPEKVFREVSDKHEELLNMDNDAKFEEYLEELQQKQKDIEEATLKLQEEKEAERKFVEKAIKDVTEMQRIRKELRAKKNYNNIDRTIPESAYQPEMQPPSTSRSNSSNMDSEDLWNLLGCSYRLQDGSFSAPGPSAGSIRNQMSIVEQYIQRKADEEAVREEQESLFDLDAALAGEGYEDARSELEPTVEPEYTESQNWVSELVKVALDDYQNHQMSYSEAKEFLDAVNESNNFGEAMDNIAKIEIEQAVAKLRYLHFGMVDPAMPQSVYDIEHPSYCRNPELNVEVEHDFDDGASVSTAIEPEEPLFDLDKDEPIIRNRKALYKKKRGEVMKKYKELERKQNKKLLDRLRRNASIKNCPCNDKEKPLMIDYGTCPEGEVFKNDQYREVHLNEDYRYIPERTELCLKEESDMEYSGVWCPHVNYPVYDKVLRLAIWDFQAGNIIDPALVVLKSHNVRAIIPHTPEMSITRANNDGVFDLPLSFVVTSESADATAVVQIVDLGYEQPRPISNYIYLWHCGPYTKPILEEKNQPTGDWWYDDVPSVKYHVRCGKNCSHELPVQDTFARLWNDSQPKFSRTSYYNTYGDLDEYNHFYPKNPSTAQTVQKTIRCCECKGPCSCQGKKLIDNGNDAEYPFDDYPLYSFAGAQGDYRRLPNSNAELINLLESDLEPIGLWCPHVPLPVFRKLITVSMIAGSELTARGWTLSLVRYNNIQAVVPGEATVTPEYIMDFTTEKCYDIELMVVVQDITKDAYAVCQIVNLENSRNSIQTQSSYLYIWFDAKNRKERLEWMGYEPHPVPSTYYIDDCSSHAAHPYPNIQKFQQFYPQMCEFEPCFEHPESDKDDSETEEAPIVEDDNESTVTAIEPEDQELDQAEEDNESTVTAIEPEEQDLDQANEDNESTVTAIEPEDQELDKAEEDNESTVTAIEPEDQDLDEFEQIESSIVPYSDSDDSEDEWDGNKIEAKEIQEDQESVATAIENEDDLEEDSSAWDYNYEDDRESYKTVSEPADEDEMDNEMYKCTLCGIKFEDFEDFMPHMVAHLSISSEKADKKEAEEDAKVKEERETPEDEQDAEEYSFVTEKDVAPSTSGSSAGTAGPSDYAVTSSDGSDFEIINESDEDY